MYQLIVKNELKIFIVSTEEFDRLKVFPTHHNIEHIVYVDINSSRLKPSSYKALHYYSECLIY